MSREKVTYPRDLAVRVLTRVLSDGKPLDEALTELSGELTPAQRGWLQEVCSGTLRWKGRLDQIVDSTALKKKPSGWLRKMLLVASYQLVAQDRTQPGAVVSETVSEIKRKEGEAPAKFANAALRKISEHARSWRELEPAAEAKPEDLAAWGSLPSWLWWRFQKQHGREWAQAYARASLERPQIWVRAKTADWKAEWAEPGPVPGSYRLTQGGMVSEREGFATGEFFVQDISSQLLIAEISAEVRKVLGGESPLTALDLCAAPGGKSVGLAWSGFAVTASDRDEARMRLLRQTVERVASSVRVVEKKEVSSLPLQDLVWVDAPCSGSGILRRHPDVRWLRQEKELAGLEKVQQQVLAEGWERVKPGGFLVYSVCSVLKEEGPIAIEKAGLQASVKKTWVLAPHLEPWGDGFWAALVQKP